MAADDAMGVTALLDELLAEQCSRQGGAGDDPTPHPHVEATPELMFNEDDAAVKSSDSDDGGTLEGQLAKHDEEAEQLAALCGEMELCLASLDGWEAERERDAEALKRELEKQYGFSYEEAVGTLEERAVETDENSLPDCDDVQCYVAELPSANLRQLGSAHAPPGNNCAPTPVAPYAEDEAAMRRADEERMARLRADIEALQQKEAQVPWQQVSEVDDLDSPVSGVAAWNMEVEEVLQDLECNIESSEYGSKRAGLETLEGQLAVAQERGGAMQEALDNARNRIDAELRDLDAMLSECDAITAMAREHRQQLC